MAMTDSARLASLALSNYVRKKIELPTRKSYFLQEIQKRGRQTMGNGGLNIEWRPEKRRHELTWGPGNPNVVNFPQTNLWTKATLSYKTCHMGASISEIELLSLGDKSTNYFNKLQSVGDRCVEDFKIRFAPHLFRDGTGSQKIDGLESFGSVSGMATNEPIGLPNDTYAGLSTALGSDGDWSAPSGGGWPRCGSDPDACDYEYHYFSPLIVNYNDSEILMDSSSESPGWDEAWIYACRYLTTYCGIVNGEAPDVIILDPDLLRRAENSLKTNQRFQLDDTSKALDPGVRVVHFEGITFATEWGVPAGCGYGINFSQLELKCMGKDFIKMSEDTDIVTADKLYRLSWHGNLWVSSPTHFPMLKAVSSLGT